MRERERERKWKGKGSAKQEKKTGFDLLIQHGNCCIINFDSFR